VSRPTCRGFTLLELLVTFASSLLILAAIGSFCRSQGRLFDQETRGARLREASRRVLEMVAGEIRAAGFAPVPGTFDGAADGLSVATVDRIEVRSDSHGEAGGDPPDGSADPDSDERIGFFLNAARGLINQTIGRQTVPLTLDSSVPPGGFRLRYFDACEREMAPPAGAGLDPAERAEVRRIAVELEIRDASGGRVSAATSAALRNREGLRCP
jgi:type II secretory pathway pseudopilin PulG